MEYRKYPDDETVNEYIKRKEPLIIAIPFDDTQPVIVAHVKDADEHHTLLTQLDILDKNFRVVINGDSADWTFMCPHNYKGISDPKRRITQFYNDGFAAISKVLSDIGYFSDIRIPRWYRCFFDALDNG